MGAARHVEIEVKRQNSGLFRWEVTFFYPDLVTSDEIIIVGNQDFADEESAVADAKRYVAEQDARRDMD